MKWGAMEKIATDIYTFSLLRKNGFTYVGDFDLDRGYEHIPVFSLYELNW